MYKFVITARPGWQHVLGAILALTIAYDYSAREGGRWREAQFDARLSERPGGRWRRGLRHAGAPSRPATALGMKVRARARGRHGPGAPAGAGLASRTPLVRCARPDVLTLHCPLTPATRGLIGPAQLALMKPDAIVINTARGALIDVAALAQALREGRLGGAAIDVLAQEPPVEGSPLFAADLPNLIVTPHVAWAARESRQRSLDEIAANVADFLAGGRRGRVV